MRSKKVNQQTTYNVGKQTSPPYFKKLGTRSKKSEPNEMKRPYQESLTIDSTLYKRPKITAEQEHNILDYFKRAMGNYLTLKITSALRGSSTRDDLKRLEDIGRSQTLPRGLKQDTAKLVGCNSATVSNYLENNSPKKNGVMWREFFDREYEKSLQKLKKSDQSKQFEQSESATNSEELVYRTFSVSINKLFRADLQNSIKEEVMEKLLQSQVKCSNYIAQYEMIVNLMILKLRSSTFTVEGNDLVLSNKKGSKISALLPSDFKKNQDFNIDYSAPPISSEILTNTKYKKDYDLLFQEQHMSLIHSYFFGASGSKQINLITHPVQDAFFKSLASNDLNSGQYKNTGLSDAEMITPREKFITNLSNMWESNANSHVLVGRAVEVLIKINLAPKRYA